MRLITFIVDPKKLAWLLAFIWAGLFSLNSLGTCLMVGLSNSVWSQMTLQSKFLIGVGITVNWSGTMMAFISKAIHNLDQGKMIPTSDTNLIGKISPPSGLANIAKIGIVLMALGWAALLYSTRHS